LRWLSGAVGGTDDARHGTSPRGSHLTVEEWRAVKGRAANRHRLVRERQHPLANLAECGRCGAKLLSAVSTNTVKGVPYKYELYRCSCTGCAASIGRENIERYVRSAVRLRLLSSPSESLVLVTAGPASGALDQAGRDAVSLRRPPTDAL
jgi:hypothetical protein